MVAPVRNPLIPLGQSAQQPTATPAVTAAQRAFFDAAMGRAGAPAPPQPAPAPMAAAPAADVRPARGLDLSQPPQRILPPGSLINIRV